VTAIIAAAPAWPRAPERLEHLHCILVIGIELQRLAVVANGVLVPARRHVTFTEAVVRVASRAIQRQLVR
jgi:hypothetical protein